MRVTATNATLVTLVTAYLVYNIHRQSMGVLRSSTFRSSPASMLHSPQSNNTFFQTTTSVPEQPRTRIIPESHQQRSANVSPRHTVEAADSVEKSALEVSHANDRTYKESTISSRRTEAPPSSTLSIASSTSARAAVRRISPSFMQNSVRYWTQQEDPAPPAYECSDPGESYAASYLTRKAPLLVHRYGIAPAQHMETGGTVFRRQFIPYKTINMFDFGVEHLSWLERRLGSTNLPPAVKTVFVDELLRHLRVRQDRLMREVTLAPSIRHSISSKVLGIMPFFSGGSGDAGHSVPELRRLYLNVSFWSFYRHVHDLAVCVCTDDDRDWLRFRSGLPWFDVIKEDCRVNVTKEKGKPLANPYIKWKPSLLGVLTSRRAQQKLRSDWHHE